ncbi:hypothetical protein CWE15_09050 [Aliidiomarina taiwanensis]|uniref:Uncharacterized protein n=1 Tax=Aliidiomarina taiwanensis TaxID=946228 RepID=A0A432X170_9GAMM|nr:HEPN domain-containing protein [Aliidiomarina taiwanensis]RUO39888.1 hypothetical protein CWE15_09050 [Aliidiomarina taiwanensis]
MDYKQLKAYQREHREGWAQGLSLRVHRALSWLKKAELEREREDLDGEFVFLWVSFNAAYASNHSVLSRAYERDVYGQFFERLVGYDTKRKLYNLVWSQYSGSIRTLLNNKYVFQPYWDDVNDKEHDLGWEERFAGAKKRANTALGSQDTVTVLSIIMDRLYTLRNQLLHGGATYGSGLNREQVQVACQLLGDIVPLVIHLMMCGSHEVWGDAAYFEAGKG